jgi:hypothetical protein
MVEQGGFVLFPEGRMLILKPFKDCFHNCFTEEFRFIFDPVTVAVDAECPHLPVVEHEGKPVNTPEPLFFISDSLHQLKVSGSHAKLENASLRRFFWPISF